MSRKKGFVELFASDIHFPFENKLAWQLFLATVRRLQPDIIWLGGDIMDMYKVSHWERDSRRKMDLQEEVTYTRRRLEELRRAAPNAMIFFKEGNHETRLTRYLESKASELRSLECLELPKLLDLSSLDMTWVANFEKKKIGKLYHIHGNEISGGGVNPAAVKVSKMNANVIFGHHHVSTHYDRRSYDDTVHAGYANPCLCDLNPEFDHHPNWTNGIARIEYNRDGSFHVDQIPIIHRTDHSYLMLDHEKIKVFPSIEYPKFVPSRIAA